LDGPSSLSWLYPFWGSPSSFLSFKAYILGYSVLATFGISWVTFSLNLKANEKFRGKLRYFIVFSYYSMGHFAVAVSMQIVQVAFEGNFALQTTAVGLSL